MRFEVLGPLRVTSDEGPLRLGGRQQRLVLALLLAADGATLRTEELVEQVWEGDPPATARKALQGHVHHLRTLVGDVLTTEPGGYALPGVERDVDRFHALQREARDLLEVDPDRASALLREALDLWRGPAYGDLRDHPRIEEVGRALDLARLGVLADRVDADLALGLHGDVAGELTSLVAEYPFDERFRGQHLLALHRCGRQVEALRSYERYRRRLADELGLEPAAPLRTLEQRILQQDPALAGPSTRTGTARGIRGFELREELSSDGAVTRHRAYQRSPGRDVVLTVLGPQLADDPAFVAGHEATAKRVAAIAHPHVLPLLDAWREPGRAYLVNPWLPGGTLHDRARRRPTSTAFALRVLREVAGGLDALHRAGVVHGELDARAVWLDADDHAWLGDAGRHVTPLGDAERARDEAAFQALARDLLAAHQARVTALDEVAEQGTIAPLQLVRRLEQAAGVAPTAAAAVADGRRATRNPYKGLRAFDETDADDFHGRDVLVDMLEEAVERHHLVAVVGASGSGKSSAVRAGLLPRLRRSAAPRRLVTQMFPGSHPFEELAEALGRVAVADVALDALDGDERRLLRAVKQLRPDDDTEVVLLVDQLEELWSMVADDTVRDRFVGALVTAVTEPRSPLRVVVTMRADFFDRPLADPRLGPLVRDGLVPVTVPTPAELAQAVVRPARGEGVTFDDGVVTRIVGEVGGEPGALPLLQHALTELFEQRSADVVTMADLDAVGGVLGAVGRRAEALYREQTEQGRAALREVLLRLVGLEADARDVRRRVRRSELDGLDLDRRVLDQVLGAFAAHRLVVLDRDEATRGATVEIAHEALLREWPRLRGWIEEHEEDLRLRRRLAAAVDEWTGAGEDDAYLVRGSRLAGFEEWTAATTLAITQAEHAFLQRSVEREAAVRRNEERRRRRLTAGLAVVSVVLATIAGFAVVQQRRAETIAADAETARLVATSGAMLAEQPRDALLAAVAAHRRDPSPATLGGLQVALMGQAPILQHLGVGRTYLDAAWMGPDHVLGVRVDGVDLFDPSSGDLLDELTVDVGLGSRVTEGLGVAARASGAAGTATAVVATGREAHVLDVVDGRLELRHALDAGAEVWQVAVADDASWTSATTADGQLVVWDDDGAEQHREAFATGASIADVIEADLPRSAPLRFLFEGTPLMGVVDAVGDELWLTVGSRVHRRAPDGTDLGSFVVGVELDSGVQLASMANRFERVGDELVITGIGMTRVAGEPGDDATLPLVEFRGTVGGHNPNQRPGAFAEGLVWSLLTDGTFAGFDPVTGEETVRHELQLTGVESTVASPDRSRLVGTHDDGLVVLSPLGANPIGAAVPRHPRHRTLSLTSDARHLVMGQVEIVPGPADVLEVRSRDDGVVRAERLDLGFTQSAAIAVLPELGEPLFVRVPTSEVTPGTAQVFEELFFRLDGDEPVAVSTWWSPPAVNSSAFAPRRDVVVTGELDRFVVRRASDPADVLHEVPRPDGLPEIALTSHARFHPDQDRVLLAFGNGRAQLLDAATWEPVDDDAMAGLDLAAGFWNDDGSLFATASSTGELVVRDGETFEPVVALAGGTGTSNTVGAGALLFVDGDRRLLGNLDGFGRLWDLASGEPIGQPFPTARETLSGVAQGEHGELLTAADRAAILWDLDVDGWVDVACRVAGGNPTAEQWARWGPTDADRHAICPEHPLPA